MKKRLTTEIDKYIIHITYVHMENKVDKNHEDRYINILIDR